ncbi:MAG: response regulator transcription factor [Sulfurospirillaceae bacterium]|nr:response regulator transcription factor [Sulfurospirillaceae bacterium]
MNILVVEDDAQIASYLQKGLLEESFSVDVANDGVEGLACIRKKTYDVIVLDWMLPNLDGIDICTIARKNNINTPILMLSAKSSIQDRIEGLNSGADDYLPKPFSFDELIARINALLRRKKFQKANILEIADLVFDITERKATRAGKLITLTIKEYELLEILMENKGHVVSTKKIISHLWKDETISSNIIIVLIHHLRSKIDDGHSKKLIKTIRKIGYKIDDV